MSALTSRRTSPVGPTIGLAIGLVLFAGPGSADPGDTTWVHTFDHDFYNWATPHDSTFTFPDGSVNYKEILIYYRLECPEAPGDCDPWDRIGYLQIRHDTGQVDGFSSMIKRYEREFDRKGREKEG